MPALHSSADIRSASGPWAVTGEGLLRDGKQVADAGEWSLNCVLDRGDAPPLVGAAEAHLLVLDGDRLVPLDGFEHAEGRESWYTPWGGPPDVRSLAADDAGGLFVNVHVGGILRSLDSGTTWGDTIDKDVDVHRVLCHDDLVLAACGDGGLAVSHDRGATWTFRTDGLHGTYCRAVAIANDTVIVSASTGPFTKEGALYRAPLRDDDTTFERCTDVFGFNIDTFQLAASGADVAFGTEDGEVYRSTDEGLTWDLVEKLPKTVRSVSFSA